jgi:uncharacterized protein YqgV (UPF0045/DUF77 family)
MLDLKSCPRLLKKSHAEACKNAGTERMLTNLKIQVDFEKDVTIDDKMEKYSKVYLCLAKSCYICTALK